MMKNVFTLILLVAALQHVLYGQENIPLYEDGKVPNAIHSAALTDTFSFKRHNKDTTIIMQRTLMPSLTVYEPAKDKLNGIGIVIFSGGGYFALANLVEGNPAAKVFTEAGYTVFVCNYRVPRKDLMNNKEIVPVQDAQRAIQYVRVNCKKFNIDAGKIGIMGFPAGGHLASTAGTHYKQNYTSNPENVNLRPDFMILVYPVISFRDSITHLVSRNNLIGPVISAEKIQEYSNELHVDADTPPTFLVASIDDATVKVANSLLFLAACQQNNVPVELFMYEKGVHGYGVNNPQSKVQWVPACISWINQVCSAGRDSKIDK